MPDTSYLFNGSAPPAVDLTNASDSGLPAWYQEYVRGIAGRATDIAGQQSGQPVPQRSVAGFNGDQVNARQSAIDNMGSWRGGVDAAGQQLGDIMPNVARGSQQAADSAVDYGSAAGAAAQNYGQQATSAVAGGPQKWTQEYQNYMSPYTQGVVDNISRLGTRNFNENIMPGINSSMIGSGQFGSTRNADVLARAGRDVQADITGAQSNALQSGYGMSADIYAGDAGRAQQQQQMQSAAALGAGQNVAGALNTAGAMTSGAINTATNNYGNLGLNTAGQQGALGSLTSQLGFNDANTQLQLGNQQQSLAQTGLDTNYQNSVDANNYDWSILNNVNGAVRGMPLNTTPTSVSNGPTSTYQPGALQSVYSAYAQNRGNGGGNPTASV